MSTDTLIANWSFPTAIRFGVGRIAEQHGTGHAPVLYGELAVDAVLRIAEDNRVGAGIAQKVSGREHADAGHFEVGRE